MFKDMTPTAWAEVIGGFFIFLYVLIQVVQKIIDHSKWGQERKAEKEAKKLEEAHAQYKKFTDEFVSSFVPPLVQQFADQDEKLFFFFYQLTKSSNDMLRQSMTNIYYKYIPYKKILNYDKECFLKLYEDYTSQGGNSYIQDIYNELKTWDVVLKKEELKS